MLRNTTMVIEAKRDVKYRYICERCDVVTDWLVSAIYAPINIR